MTQFRDNAIRNRGGIAQSAKFSQAREINAIGVNIERNANWRVGRKRGHSKLPLSRSRKVDVFYVR